jgi:hypothetical protein
MIFNRDFGYLNMSSKGLSGVVRQAGIVALLCASMTMFARTMVAQQGMFVLTGSLNDARDNHTATLLNNGKVLIAGGMGPSGVRADSFALASAELYDRATGTFTLTGSLNKDRQNHTATLLKNGKVLIAGGQGPGGNLVSAELWDPATATFTLTGSLNTARQLHTATLLRNGKVLITGGQGADGISLASAELYDPTSGTFTVTGSLNVARQSQTATPLDNGMVLVVGGFDAINSGTVATLDSTELYQPTTGTFTPTGTLNNARVFHTATLLRNGSVLVAGGQGPVIGPLATAELYNTKTGTFTVTGGMNAARESHTATLLNNGTVLVAAGFGGNFLNSAELYNPSTATFTLTGSLNDARDSQTATLLHNGTVLVAGGFVFTSFGTALDSAELYHPSCRDWPQCH